jgi:prepilin-type N-terminal cleavage/methylation domain-containing protein
MNRRAMTLLEVVVALTIAGAALAVGATALGFLTDQQNRTGTQAVTSANTVRTSLRDWIAEARLTTNGDAEFRGIASSRAMQAGEDDELTFVTSAPTHIGSLGTIVHLYIAHGERDSLRGLVAELRPWRFAGAPAIVSLAPEATGFQARYLASLHGPHDWQKGWTSTSVLPAAVQLRITFDRASTSDTIDRAAQSLLAIPMTIPLAWRQ